MIDRELYDKTLELELDYKNIYGKNVDYTLKPKGLNQRKLVQCLELMIKHNYSLTVAFNKIREMEKEG